MPVEPTLDVLPRRSSTDASPIWTLPWGVALITVVGFLVIRLVEGLLWTSFILITSFRMILRVVDGDDWTTSSSWPSASWPSLSSITPNLSSTTPCTLLLSTGVFVSASVGASIIGTMPTDLFFNVVMKLLRGKSREFCLSAIGVCSVTSSNVCGWGIPISMSWNFCGSFLIINRFKISDLFAMFLWNYKI